MVPDPIDEDSGGQRVLGIDDRVGQIKPRKEFAAGLFIRIAQDTQKSRGRLFAEFLRISANENLHRLSSSPDTRHQGARGGWCFGQSLQLSLKLGHLLLLGFGEQTRQVILGDKERPLGVLPEHVKQSSLIGGKRCRLL